MYLFLDFFMMKGNHDGSKPHSNELFTSVQLRKKSPGTSKWNKNEVVYFPKLEQTTSVDTLWMLGFLHHENKTKEKKAKIDLAHMIQLPGSSVLPKAAKSLSKRRSIQYKKNSNSSYLQDKGSITEEEMQHLKTASKHLFKDTAVASGNKKLFPYYQANARLNKIRRNKQTNQDNMKIRSRLLERYFLINRNELEAAICLQCFWRRIVAIRSLHRLSIEKTSATIIQAAVRSMLLRCWLRTWIKKRAHFIIVCQAHLRRRIAHRRWKYICEVEYRSARYIQGLVRIYLAKSESTFRRRVNAVNIIISHYNGYKGRKHYITLRQNLYATKIQTLTRVLLSKKFFEKTKREKVGAAKDIQRSWRGYLSRELSSTLLYDRYLNSCQIQIRMFDCDINYYISLIKSPENIATNNSNHLKEKMIECESNIKKSERKLDELQKSLRRLTPKLVNEGWKEQLEKDSRLERIILTKSKINTIFEVQKVDATQKMQNKRQTEFKNGYTKKVDSLQKWKSNLTFMLHRESQEREKAKNERSKRQAIADEKRKWVVQHTINSGKPFKKRDYLCTNNNNGNIETREQRLMKVLKMQTYFTQLSQLENSTKPLDKLNTACQQACYKQKNKYE